MSEIGLLGCVYVRGEPEPALVMPKRDKEVLKCQGSAIALC